MKQFWSALQFKSARARTQRVRQQDGFTLVELMVAVAIIGILASISISKYTMYTARARTSESKLLLASARTALNSFYASEGSFTMCLNEAGFQMPTGAKRWFTVGFGPTTVPTTCGPTANTACNAYKWNNAGAVVSTCANSSIFTNRNSQINGPATIPTDGSELDAASTSISQTAFVISAVGYVGDDTP